MYMYVTIVRSSGNTTISVCFSDHVDECTSNPCLNGGVCTNRLQSYRCSCPTHLSGTNCEIGKYWPIIVYTSQRHSNFPKSSKCNISINKGPIALKYTEVCIGEVSEAAYKFVND